MFNEKLSKAGSKKGLLNRLSGMMDNISYVQGSAQALVIILWPHVSTASLSKGQGFTGVHRPIFSAASTLSL